MIFSQSSVYIITEQYSGMNNTKLDKVIVTSPDGETTNYDIPHFLEDVEAHDSEFAKIINSVTEKGYKPINGYPNAHGDMMGTKNVFTRTWLFIKDEE